MNIPRTVKVGPHVYKVRLLKMMAEDHGKVGQVVNSKAVLTIDPDQSSSQVEDTFLHEVLHAINSQVKFVKDDDEEDAVLRLAPAILQVLKDNRKAFVL